MADVVQPKGWPRPAGYAHGMVAAGRILAVAGQIGSKPPQMELARDFTTQFAQTLDNVIGVVEAAGGRAMDIISMTVFVVDRRQYQAATKEVGAAWRARFGGHYPAMTLVEVSSLLEPHALVEIQALAVLA